jgi:hypothetical protein
MSVGLPQGKDQIDAYAGSLVLNLIDALNKCADFNNWLGRVNNGTYLQGLTSPTTGQYSAADITALVSQFAAAAKLNDIAHARDVQAAVNDFFFSAPQLVGPQFQQ